MYSNQLHLLAADEQTALIAKFGRNVQVHILKTEPAGPVIDVRGKSGKYIVIEVQDEIRIEKYPQTEPAVKLPQTYRSIEDLLG